MNQLQALGLTLACELPVMAVLARSVPIKRLLIIATGASCLTHPLAWRAALVLSADQYVTGLWLIELCVVLIEALWYQAWLRVGTARALWWSLVANATSFGLGWLL